MQPKSFDIVVFCHLRWEFVFQRPQHIMTQLSKDRKILFVEEPIPFDETNKGTANVIKPTENITVIQPRISWEDMVDEATPLVKQYIKELSIKNPFLWFYAPMYSHILEKIDHDIVIYDAMDELSLFRGAPPALVDNEKFLLQNADIVFTGGKSLYESKKQHHSNVFCFPSSVDSSHFKKALAPETKIPDDISSLKKPIIGYYGVIDERIDLELIEDIATKLPEVSFVMIGPVVKINKNDLPKQSNIHYLGGKDYKELPAYLKGIDIAMMPFALNKATKFISPTKTLEFMAALKPIVSTPIYDVVRDYSKEVIIAKTSEEFVKALEQYIQESSKEKTARELLQKNIIRKTSWDTTVSEMKQIIEKA